MDECLTFFATKTETSLETATASLRPDLKTAGVYSAPNGSCVLAVFMCNLPLGLERRSSVGWFEM